jgi:hypothetical protein
VAVIAIFVCSNVFGQILAPLSQTLTNGSVVVIRWVPPKDVGHVRLRLSTDEYHTTTINRSATNSGEYSWVVSSEGYDTRHYRKFFITIEAGWNQNMRTSYFTLVDDPGALPKILTPTENQVVYVGDNVEITWEPKVKGKGATNVVITVTGNMGGIYFKASVPNTGSYTWAASKSGAHQEHFTLDVADGSAVTNKSSVQIVIPNRNRPTPVPVTIRKVVSIEWDSIPNHLYRVESSVDMQNWTTEFEDRATEDKSAALFYEADGQFYRVYDITQ